MTSLWQQAGAPAHRARETVELLKEATPDFIPPSLWPPNSPDLNPVGYSIWGIMQERVYNKGKIANVEELRQGIVDEWERLDQRIIDGVVKTTASVCCCWRRIVWTLVKHCCCNCALWLWHLIVWLLITFAVTVFSVLWLFQSHAAVVERYNAFCVKRILQTVTPNKITSANQHFLYVLVNIFTFNELWNVTFCHKTRRVCNVRRQNSCDKFYKVV